MYFIEIGYNQIVSLLTDKTHCDWWQPKLTLADVEGTGTCLISKTYDLGTPPYSDACSPVLWDSLSGQQY